MLLLLASFAVSTIPGPEIETEHFHPPKSLQGLIFNTKWADSLVLTPPPLLLASNTKPQSAALNKTQMHVQHHKYKCCTQIQPPSLTTSMDIEHIQAFMDAPGTAAWDSAQFSDSTPHVVALQQTLVTNCTFNQCDAFTLCLSTTHPSSTGFQTLRCQRQSKQHHHRTNKCRGSLWKAPMTQ